MPEPTWSLPEEWPPARPAAPPRAPAPPLSAAAAERRPVRGPGADARAAPGATVPHAELLGVVGLLGGVGVLLLLLALWPRRHRSSRGRAAPTPSKPARPVPV